MNRVKRPSVDWRKAIRDLEDLNVDEAFWLYASKSLKMRDKTKKRKKPVSFNKICYNFCKYYFGKSACERYRWLGSFL